ncbi:MAG: leucyl/phenylalanyl-tRNA--protein transferase [Halioglobus sp.]
MDAWQHWTLRSTWTIWPDPLRDLPVLDYGGDFPPSHEALDYPNGLLAVGGQLSTERLLQAYHRGIFPWYEEPQTVLWWTPEPRSVLFPDEVHISKSLRKTLRKDNFALSVDCHFETVISQCGETRSEGPGTWISDEMIAAYTRLHHKGFAHSIEVHNQRNELVAGLYGVALGRIFFGESMFSLEADSSKVALMGLIDIARRGQFELIDCQIESEHMNSLGARNISRLDFEAKLEHTVDMDNDHTIWRLPKTSGGLL